MVTAEVMDVQQVTTRSKGKTVEWETREVGLRMNTTGQPKERGRIKSTSKIPGRTGREHEERLGMAGFTTMSDYATIGPAFAIDSQIYRRVKISFLNTKSGANTGVFLKPR